MKLRKTKYSDLESIMQIIAQAQIYFSEQGIDQWQDNYPNKESLRADIDRGESYVLCSDNEPIATAMISYGKEPTYAQIEGEWLSDAHTPYVVIHRVAVSRTQKRKGCASFIMKCIIDKNSPVLPHTASSFRIDTHKDNKAMLRLIKQFGFQYCGIIKVDGGAERLAFERYL